MFKIIVFSIVCKCSSKQISLKYYTKIYKESFFFHSTLPFMVEISVKNVLFYLKY